MTQNTKLVTLPKTFAAIDAEFPGRNNAGLRKELKASALLGGLPPNRFALTASGEAGMRKVERVLAEEWVAGGYSRYVVGPSDSYHGAPVVAFLDQPY